MTKINSKYQVFMENNIIKMMIFLQNQCQILIIRTQLIKIIITIKILKDIKHKDNLLIKIIKSLKSKKKYNLN